MSGYRNQIAFTPFLACLILMVILFFQAGTAASARIPEPKEIEKTKLVGSSRCGVERWSVKTLTDSPTLLATKPISIATLDAKPVPAGFNQNSPRLPGESQKYRLSGTRLVSVKLESDSDYHLLLQSPTTGKTMIAEIPSPDCAQGSSELAAITQTRAYFDQTFGPGTRSFRQINRLVTITGVAFFDVLHGQSGVAPNGIELHPVLSIKAL